MSQKRKIKSYFVLTILNLLKVPENVLTFIVDKTSKENENLMKSK